MPLDLLAQSVGAALAGDPAMAQSSQELTEKAFRHFRALGGHVLLFRELDDVRLRALETGDEVSMTALLAAAGRDYWVQSLNEVFDRAGAWGVAFLPNVDLLEFELGLGTLKDGGSFLHLRLMERLVHRVVIFNDTPMLQVKRLVSPSVVRALDALFLSMTGIDRTGCGEQQGPDEVLQWHGQALRWFLGEPGEIADFLASVDLVLHAYPAEVQQGVLRLMAQSMGGHARDEVVGALLVLQGRGAKDVSPGSTEARPEGVGSALAALRGEELVDLSFTRRPVRVRRLLHDTEPGPTLPLAFPPPLIPVERVASEAQAASMEDEPWPHEKTVPGVVLVGASGGEPVWRSSDAAPLGLPDRAQTFRERCTQLLARAARSTPREFPHCVEALAEVAQDSMKKGDYADVWGVFRFLRDQEGQGARSDPASLRALETARKRLLKASLAADLCEALPHALLAEQSAILELLAAMGLGAVRAILDLNATYHLGPSLRGSLIAVLERGPEGTAEVLALYLEEHKTRLHRLTPLIEVLGTLDRGAYRDSLMAFSHHRVVAVREASLGALSNAMGREAVPLLLRALSDEHPAVCQRAATLLGLQGCREEVFLDWLEKMVLADNPRDVREEGVLLASLRAFRALGSATLRRSEDIEALLIGRLGLSRGLGMGLRGLSLRGLRMKNDLSPRVLEAFCRTLGTVGSTRSLPVLAMLLAQGSPNVQGAAREALGRLNEGGG